MCAHSHCNVAYALGTRGVGFVVYICGPLPGSHDLRAFVLVSSLHRSALAPRLDSHA